MIGVVTRTIAGAMQSETSSDMSIEELAQKSGVSIDTIRFYQSRGLLMAPTRQGRRAYYGAQHLDRIAQIREYQHRGLSLRDIEMRVVESNDHPLDPPGVLYDFESFASRIGMPAALVQAMIAEGVLVPITQDGLARFSAQDVKMANLALSLLGEGLPFSELLALSKAHHARMEASVSEAIELFERHLRIDASDASPEDFAREFATFAALHQSLVELVALHFDRLLVVRARQRLLETAKPTELSVIEELAKAMMSR